MSGETMGFPRTLDEFMEQYKIVDTEQVYTNGTELVPIFRIKQWEDAHEPKKGKWIVEGHHPNYLLRCSACQEIAMWAGGISYIYPNFCPKCGAEMENGDERFNQPTGGD